MNAFPSIPLLAGATTLRHALPTVVVDTREQDPLPLTRLPWRRGTLMTGDYSVAGLELNFAIERKSLADLAACCVGDNRDRFERELHRLRGFRFRRLLLIGTRAEVEAHQYPGRVTPQAVLGTLHAFEARYDVPVVWAARPEPAGQQVELWAWWYAREAVLPVNDLTRASRAKGEPST